ncbi:MAG: hypothetical protein ACOYD4_03930 [Solirubrobacterales bacterium]
MPGIEGDAGPAGTNGINGTNSSTTLTADLTIPAINAPVAVTVVSNAWMVVGQVVVSGDGVDFGTFRVVSKTGTTGATLTFLGAPGDSAPAAVIANGSIVTPGGAPQSTPLAIASGGTGSATVQAATLALGLKKTPLSVAAAGTAYSLTNTAALLNFGTTDPSLTINAPGTYLLLASVRIDYTAATFAAVRTLTLKIRRTNNTAADITGATRSAKTDIITTLTYTLGDIQIPPAVYVTTNSDDVLEIWGSIDVVPSAGSIDAVDATLVAVRLFDQTL